MTDTYVKLPPVSGGGGGTTDHAALSNLAYADSGHSGFQPALGFTAENVTNKDTTATLGASDTKYPSQKAVKTYVDTAVSGVTSPTLVGTANQVIITGTTTKTFSTPQDIATTSSPTFVTASFTGLDGYTEDSIPFINKTTSVMTSNGKLLYDSVGEHIVSLSGVGAAPAGYTGSVLELMAVNSSYIQTNIQNQASGNDTSSDYVATADNGTDTTNFVDMGINNSGFTSASWTLNGAVGGYVYASSGDFAIGTGANKEVCLFTGGTLAANKRFICTNTLNSSKVLMEDEAGSKTDWIAVRTDGVAALTIRKADNTAVVATFDTTNSKLTVAKQIIAGESLTGQALTAGALSSEYITNATDRDFSGAGNWTGTNWSVSTGVFAHTAGANSASLANVNLTAAPVPGEYYQIVLTLATSITGTVAISFGGTTGANIGINTSTQTAYTVVLQATNTNPLTVTPNGSWVGSIDNVSVTMITKNSAALILKDSTSAIVIEERPVNSTTMGIGLNALIANVTGVNNVAVGNNSMQSMVSGSGNTSVGTNSLNKNTKGTDNTAVGFGALAASTVGINNTAIGRDVLLNTLFTTGNTGVGFNALKTCTTGISNTAVGTSALTSSTSGTLNVAVGMQAGTAITSGGNNTAIGYNSLPSLTTASNNTAVGKDSGYNSGTSLAAVSGCTFIGQGANSSTNSLSNSMALGKDAQITASNQIVLGDANVTSMTTAAAINTALNFKVATVQVVGAQVAAIGLDAQTDAQKITAIISALRTHGLLGPNA